MRTAAPFATITAALATAGIGLAQHASSVPTGSTKASHEVEPIAFIVGGTGSYEGAKGVLELTNSSADSFRETFRIRSAAPRVCSTKES
jgi:hypothetical protein